MVVICAQVITGRLSDGSEVFDVLVSDGKTKICFACANESAADQVAETLNEMLTKHKILSIESED